MASEPAFCGDSISENCYTLQLACAELQIGYAWNEIEIRAGGTRNAECRADTDRITLAPVSNGHQ